MRTPEEIGKIVRQLRGSLSLRDFAKKCGVSHSTIDYIEKGYDFRTGKPTYPSASVLSKIANAAGVPLDFIVGSTPRTGETVTTLTDKEKTLIELFRKTPIKEQPLILKMIEAVINTKS